MTSFDRVAARARADAATPGPWTATTVESVGGGSIYDGQWMIASATIYNHNLPLSDKPDARGPGYINTDANAALIAHARTDLPAALDIIDAIANIHHAKHGVYIREVQDDFSTEVRHIEEPYVICDYDKTRWPCRTQLILDGATE